MGRVQKFLTDDFAFKNEIYECLLKEKIVFGKREFNQLWGSVRGKKESKKWGDGQSEREIAERVVETLNILTPRETDGMLIYENGVFVGKKVAHSKIRQTIKEIANNMNPIPFNLNIASQNMIIDFIKSFSYCSLDEFDSNPRIINLKNGLYNLDGFNDEWDFLTHDEYIETYKEPYKSLVQIPVNYDPDAESNRKNNPEPEEPFDPSLLDDF
ncbi:MAG: hypothetical protein ACXAEX_08575 [Promethearchaeota archaeon]